MNNIDQLIYEASKDFFPALNQPVFYTGRNSIFKKLVSSNPKVHNKPKPLDESKPKPGNISNNKQDSNSNQKQPSTSYEHIGLVDPAEQSDG